MAKQKRLQAIAADPLAAICKAERLVETRSTEDYCKAAEILVEVREALGSQDGPRRANEAAKALVQAHPTSNHLKRGLREHGLKYK